MSSLPTWWVISCLLVLTGPVAAQAQPPARQRQDRRALLPATASEPVLELYVAANNVTTAAFNSDLDRDSLVVDRTRFKWAEASERLLMLEPIDDLGPGERLLVKVRFKDRTLPSQAVLAIVSKPGVMDGKVEVELEEVQCADNGPSGLIFSGWLDASSQGVQLTATRAPAGAGGCALVKLFAFNGTASTLIVLRLRNLPDQRPWKLAQARLTSPEVTPVTVLSAQMKPSQLAPGESGLLVLEVKPKLKPRVPYTVDLVDPDDQRRLLFNFQAP